MWPRTSHDLGDYCLIMVGVSPEYLKEKQFAVPGRGVLATAISLLACVGAIGAWYFVAFEWKAGCAGSGDRLAPAASSRQAFRCDDLGQRDARIMFAALAVLGALVVAYAARRWMFGKLPNALLVLAALLPALFPYLGYVVVTHPSDSCDDVALANLKAAVSTWHDNGQKGPRPDFCQRV
jgi:hypothetical protein